MRILIKPGRFKLFPLDVSTNDTIKDVKEKFEWLTDTPIAILTHLAHWRLGQLVKQPLEDGRTLSSYNIHAGDTIKFRISSDAMASVET